LFDEELEGTCGGIKIPGGGILLFAGWGRGCADGLCRWGGGGIGFIIFVVGLVDARMLPILSGAVVVGVC
jgi:hypothetical protein